MSTFNDTNELYAVMDDLWKRIKADEKMSQNLLASKLVVRFKYLDPSGQLTIDGSDGEELKVVFGEYDKKPDVEMTMKSEVANQFWLGGLNVPMALIDGRIKSRGAVHRALALLPVVKPAFQIYPNVVQAFKDNAA